MSDEATETLLRDTARQFRSDLLNANASLLIRTKDHFTRSYGSKIRSELFAQLSQYDTAAAPGLHCALSELLMRRAQCGETDAGTVLGSLCEVLIDMFANLPADERASALQFVLKELAEGFAKVTLGLYKPGAPREGPTEGPPVAASGKPH
jgi:hypothetical protein